MNKELQDLAWRSLPKEFKEEVKFEYHRVATKVQKDEYDLGFMHAYEGMFGIHNLTSDAEGEILCVSRNEVRAIYDKINSIWLRQGLERLFGSKCLPDETKDETKEPKPAETKYHEGEKVRYNGYVYEVEGLVGKNRYALKGLNFDLDEGMIESYTEQEENVKSSQSMSNCDKQFNNILKDNFSKERRLNIAAMIAQGIMANSNPQMVDMNVERVVDLAILTADTLIAECNSPIN